MRFIDTHLHLDSTSQLKVNEQVQKIERDLIALGGEHGILLHLDWQKFDKKQLANEVQKYENLSAYVNVVPGSSGDLQELRYSVNSLGFKGLKLHPRYNDFRLDSKSTIAICLEAGNLGIPVLIDAFVDGEFLKRKINIRDFSDLAEKCPNTNFIWAHMGGYKVLDFLFIGKHLPNVFMDFSFTLQYFQGSSVIADVIYAIRNLRFERLFYGSDFPDRSIGESLRIVNETFLEYGLTADQIDQLFYRNAVRYLGI
jgi:predicted TIM-barrel fold metal-dependent hydrolase